MTHNEYSLPRDMYQPFDELPLNNTYGEWTAKWWQWVLPISREENPVSDVDNKFANKNQDKNGLVWFLAGTNGGREEYRRSVEIPRGKSILFPVINTECSILGEGYRTEAELRTCAKSYIDNTKEKKVKIKVNNFEYEQLEQYSKRVQSPIFQVTFSDKNIFGHQGGTSWAVSDGYWIFLKPLPVGKHEIYFMGEDFFIFKTEVTYELTIY